MTGSRQDAPSEGGTDPRWRAWRGILEVSSFVLQRSDEDLRDQVGIDIQTYDALLHTREAGEQGIRMTDLAERVLLTKAGLTALVDRLQERGLVAREPSPDDRRVKRVVLTPQGSALFEKAAAVHVDTLKRWFYEHLDERAAPTMAEALAHLRQIHSGADV